MAIKENPFEPVTIEGVGTEPGALLFSPKGEGGYHVFGSNEEPPLPLRVKGGHPAKKDVKCTMTMYSAKSHSLPLLVQDDSSILVFHIKHEQDIKDLNRIWRMFVAFAAVLYFGLLSVVFVSTATIVGFVAPIAVAIGFCLFVLKIDALRKNKYYDFNIVYWKKLQQIDIVSRKFDSVVTSGDASSYRIRHIHFARRRFLPCSESAACAVLVCPNKKRFVIGIGREEEMQDCICELSLLMGVVKLEDHHICLGMANRYNP